MSISKTFQNPLRAITYIPLTMTSKYSVSRPFWLNKLIVTLSIIFFVSMLIWGRAHLPPAAVILHYLSVSKFQTLDSRLVVEWVAKIAIFKPIASSIKGAYPIMTRVKHFQRIETFITNKEHVLAVNSTRIEPELDLPGVATVIVKFSTRDLEGDKMEVKDWVLDEIKKDRDSGAVIFGMEMVVWTEQYKTFWARCPNLKVDFNQAKWVVTSNKMCYVSNWYRPLFSLYRM